MTTNAQNLAEVHCEACDIAPVGMIIHDCEGCEDLRKFFALTVEKLGDTQWSTDLLALIGHTYRRVDHYKDMAHTVTKAAETERLRRIAMHDALVSILANSPTGELVMLLTHDLARLAAEAVSYELAERKEAP